MVTVFRLSWGTVDSIRSSAAHALQKREPSGFSAPQLGQDGIVEA